MTPTPIPRTWTRVENALAGVTAFDDVDRTIGGATARLPADADEARNATKLAPGVRAEATRRLADAEALRALAAEAVRTAGELRAEARRERRWLVRRVRWLLAGRVARPPWRALTFLPRVGWKVIRWATGRRS